MNRLWMGFWGVIIVSFAVLGWAGLRIYQEHPPIPRTVVTTDGSVVIPEGDIEKGQNVWQAMGGMEVGSIWGHGSYVAPDWTADWLHRECVFILDEWSSIEYNKPYADLSSEQQAVLNTRLREMMRKNTFDPSTGVLTIDPVRKHAFEANFNHYSEIFSQGNVPYAIPPGTVTEAVKLRELAAFFFWTSWAASTDRPNDEITYTSNWPHEELVGNRPAPDSIIWTGVSIMVLLAGIGGMVWYHSSQQKELIAIRVPETDPMHDHQPTPSQRATVKYFWVVSALILVQVGLGVLTAHYGVEGGGFYGIPVSKWIPYVVSRTWHTQIGIFWIATAWLAAGLYIAPAVTGVDPKGQRLGVNVLFSALLLVVVGSLTGEWLSVYHKLSGDAWFYFGHQGFEYVDLGRAWQIALLIGLALWVYLVGRCIFAAIKQNDEQKPLLILFLVASIAIGGFYAAGLMIGKHSNLAIAEYWRWWVVHLWVEGFFEVFATVVIAFMFAKLKLIRMQTAGMSVIFSSTIFLSGGIIGTLHHLYFSGTPIAVLALGAVFSALEVVPLTLVGIEAWDNIRLSKTADWARQYKWPIAFFIAVAFWNLVGAGLFGFMINPPIALYYMQGLNTTPVHGHAALFGVYGMLGIGLMLFCLRVLWVQKEWKETLLRISFWGLNIGLLAMVGISLLPVGLLQTWASVKYGYWYARSSEFLYSPTIETFKWLRAFGDTIFAFSALAIVLFVFGLATGHSFRKQR
ncbi:MAG TPA: nitric-oxide reductase large subunit [Bacteroidota bacterium]|nr:nitric-oxide reductase large subunit [Bacteroidota bacterium]